MKKMKFWLLALLAFTLGAILISCSAVQKGTDILAGAGKISEKDRVAIQKTSQALRSSFADITEEEEYYIGRAVAAMILSRYPVYNNDLINGYINTVGNAVVIYSDRPEIYAGYHFLVLDSDEVNALAAPGGFIFITRGILKKCKNEEMLASVLAHEVGHVCAKHGLQSIKKSRLVDAFRIIGQEAAKKYAPERLAELTGIFENVLGDIAEKLIERGYDRKYEYEADKLSLMFAAKTGYDPNGLAIFLQTMSSASSGESGKGWFKTHPSAKERIENVKSEIAALKKVPQTEVVRTERFRSTIKDLK
jgi:predicted Zn-dependent protease